MKIKINNQKISHGVIGLFISWDLQDKNGFVISTVIPNT
jgi:hypothetical protein